MRPSVWIAALCREFGLPVALSAALHGLVGIALGAFTLSTQLAPAQPSEGLKVDLVALEPEPAEQAAKPALRFRDVPRVLAPAASPTGAFPQAVAFSAPEPAEPLLLIESVEAASLSRPLPITASSPVRLLRDTTAEAGSIQSKARSGNNPRPEYPRPAREAGWEGTTVLLVVIMPDGTVGSITLHKTSGYAVLDEAALTAVKTWRFIPAMDGSFPLKSVVRLPIRFDLKAAN